MTYIVVYGPLVFLKIMGNTVDYRPLLQPGVPESINPGGVSLKPVVLFLATVHSVRFNLQDKKDKGAKTLG